MSYLKQIRRHCVDCMGGQYALVTACPSDTCYLWPYRAGKGAEAEYTPLKSIRLFCLQCVGSPEEVTKCTGKMLFDNDCHLWGFRSGHNARRKHGRAPAKPIQQILAGAVAD